MIIAITSLAACGRDDSEDGITSVKICLHDWDRTPSAELICAEPTCTSAAKYLAVCKLCGEKGSPYEYGEKGEHLIGNYYIDEAFVSSATCSAGDTYYKSCLYCRMLSEETFEDSVRPPHDFCEIMNKDTFRSGPTCTAGSTYYRSCSVCGALDGAYFEIGAKLSHEDGNGDYMCDHCLTPMKVFEDVPSDKIADVDEIENPYGGDAE